MDNLPIDIHSTKLLNWLISRRHCKHDWQTQVENVREKMSLAIKDMPENDRIVQLLQGSYIHYFHCKEIVEILKQTEKDTKNIFGSYSSKRMKDWQEIVSIYENNNVYLAEAAQILQRLVQYDIPALNRQVAKGESIYQDGFKKQEEYMKQADAANRAYLDEVKNMGLTGENFRKEIIQLSAVIPEYLDSIVADVVALAPVLKYLDGYRRYTDGGKNSDADDDAVLPLIRQTISKQKQFTYYELKYQKAPISIERPQLEYVEEAKGDDEIDFGDDAGIDFGDNASIDFGAEIEVLGDDSAVTDDGVARGDDALSILEHSTTLALLHGELDELSMFLHFRSNEETNQCQMDVYLSAIERKEPGIDSVSSVKLEEWTSLVNSIKEKFHDKQKRRLLKVRSSPGYIDQLVDHFEKLKLQQHKYKRLEQLSVEKQTEALQKSTQAKKDSASLVHSLVFLKEQIERDIGKKYGRECNIIGEIYSVLP